MYWAARVPSGNLHEVEELYLKSSRNVVLVFSFVSLFHPGKYHWALIWVNWETVSFFFPLHYINDLFHTESHLVSQWKNLCCGSQSSFRRKNWRVVCFCLLLKMRCLAHEVWLVMQLLQALSVSCFLLEPIGKEISLLSSVFWSKLFCPVFTVCLFFFAVSFLVEDTPQSAKQKAGETNLSWSFFSRIPAPYLQFLNNSCT